MRSRIRFQGAEPYPAPSVNLVDAYVDLLGSDETDHTEEIQALPRGDARRACMAIGRACWLYRRNTPAAERMLRRARTDLSPTLAQRAGADNAPKFHSITSLLLARDNPAEIKRVRHELYGQTMAALRALRHVDTRVEHGQGMLTTQDWKEVVGSRVEDTYNDVDSLLIREFRGKATPLGVVALDAVATHVLGVVKDGVAAGRNGLYGVEAPAMSEQDPHIPDWVYGIYK